jgi:hypothetical protein
MKNFIKYTIVWISQNLAMPFWIVGHIHLSVNDIQDIYKIIASLGMNIVVFAGFIIDYKNERKQINRDEKNS